MVSMSLSLIAVFVPLLFMGSLIGRLFHEFAMTLCISMVISLTVTPMMCVPAEACGFRKAWPLLSR